MKRLLIFHPYLAPYRIDLYNHLSECFLTKVALMAGKSELSTLGYNLEHVNQQAQFDYKYHLNGIRIGRHLISTLYVKLFKSFNPDIVLSHELGVNTLVAIFFKKLFKYRIYTTFDDSPAMATHYSKKREWLRRFVLKHIDGAIVVNPEVKEYLERTYPHYNCKYIYFPIIQDDVLLARKIIDARGMAEGYVEKYRLQDKTIILFVGRLEKMKCPDLLVEAFSKLNNPDSTLVIVGSGSLESQLKKAVADLEISNRVVFAGRLTGAELYAWYYLSHLFVLPSKYEPFGAVVNEALVAGCYTIVTKDVGAASLVNAENGAVVDSNDIDQLLSAISNGIKKHDVKNHQSKMIHPFQYYFKELISTLNAYDEDRL